MRQPWHGWCDMTEPLAHRDRVFVGGGYAWAAATRLLSLDARTGAIIWQVPTGGRFSLGRGGLSQRALAATDDRIVAAVNDGLAVYSARDGRLEWSRLVIAAEWEVTGDALYVVSAASLFALDVRSGDERWRVPLAESSSSRPVALGGRVYVAARGLGAIETFEALTGKSVARLGPFPGFNGVLATGGGMLLAQAAKDGHPVTYIVDPIEGRTSVRAALLVGLDGSIAYFSAADGQLEAVDTVSEHTLGTWSGQLPAHDGGIVVDSNLYYQRDVRQGMAAIRATDLMTGARAWSFQTGDIVKGVTLTADALYVTSGDCNVYALRSGR